MAPSPDVTERVEIDKADLQALFDLAVHSMDFGSGFWDNDDVEVARRVAVVIGVNPMTATPSNFKRHYPHAYEPASKHVPWGNSVVCWWCSGAKSDALHDLTEGGA